VPSEVEDAPGWTSVETAFADVYPGVEPVHYAPGPPVSLGGVLDGISAYRSADGWHFVTFGLTELYVKESDDPQHSGWGYELTLRTPLADAPQDWALELLHAVAQVTQRHNVLFAEGHRLDPRSNIGGDASPLQALAFTRDRAAQPRSFPFGRYVFLQLVGVTAAELEEMKATSTEAVLLRLAEHDQALRTDPARARRTAP
jgi:suppressor of fused-like protein